MKIFAVGWNYLAHNKELNPTNTPEFPVIFSKPETALLREGKPFYYPNFSQNVHYETEIVVRISKMGKNISEKFANRYYDAIALGIDFTARDLQDELKKKGAPWDICKGFDNSAPISEFIDKEKFDLNQLDFSLSINGECVQSGNTQNMIYNIDKIVAHISQFFTLKTGDMIFTGTPQGVGPVHIDDHLEGYIQGEKVLDFYVK